MSYTYTAKRRSAEQAEPQGHSAPLPQPSLEALRSGAAAPTREQMGRRVDLPDAMREKMESSFGADLSAVKLYESEAVEEAGANAVTRGSDIAFAPGMLDFSSYGGQALLGHELSHVVSQARGEVAGGGFLNDASLEARADREGAMAAAGEQVSLPSAPMSAVSAASAAGPMQANKAEDNRRQATEITQGYDRWKGFEASLTTANAAVMAPQVEKARADFMTMAQNSSRGARGILNERLRRSQESLNSLAASKAERENIPYAWAYSSARNTPTGRAVDKNKDLVEQVKFARRGKRW